MDVTIPDQLTKALTDIRTIDHDIHHQADQLARHERCDRRCQAWRDHMAEMNDLLDLRLRFMDRRDVAVHEHRIQGAA